MSDYLFGKHHERLDNFLVKHFDRPTREERFENRSTMAPQALEGALIGTSLMVGTGRVRLGGSLIKAGHTTIVTAARPLTRMMWPRKIGQQAMKAVPKILQGASMISKGSRMKRQGRILQGMGLLGWYRNR